jgi:hypothetical protein
MKIEDIPNVSLPKLVWAYLKDLKRFAGLEKAYIKKGIAGGIGKAPIGLAIAIAGLVLLALGGLMLLVTSVLVLSIWLQPWAAALIVASVLLFTGIVVALIGLMKAKKDMAKTKASFSQVGKDMRCLKSK